MIKKIFIGVFIFLILYMEPLYIGPIKFAHLWKIPFLIYLIFSVKSRFINDKIFKFSLFYYIKYFFTTGVFYFGYLADSFYMAMRGISIPLFYNYLSIQKFTHEKISNNLIFISNFIVLSGIPFVLNLIVPIGSGYDLDNYGSESSDGFVGIFQNPHGAAICISQALIILFFFIIEKNKVNVVNFLIFIFGVFILYKTYVRTGYVMFALGTIIILYFKFGVRRFYKIIPILLIFALALSYLYSADSVLRGRVTQQNIYREGEDLTVDQISSGRLTLSLVNIMNLYESDVLSQLLGFGFQYSTDLMMEVINMRKASHNGFVDALVHNGIIGFILYLIFLRSIYRQIKNSKDSIYFSLGISSFVSFILFILFQGGNVFLLEIQLLLIVYLLKITSYKTDLLYVNSVNIPYRVV